MISRALLKSEIDNVKSEYLDVLYRIVKAFENGTSKGNIAITSESQDVILNSDWPSFVDRTYGCMADSQISRGEQGVTERREEMK
jgi:hypothetical protein